MCRGKLQGIVVVVVGSCRALDLPFGIVEYSLLLGVEAADCWSFALLEWKY